MIMVTNKKRVKKVGGGGERTSIYWAGVCAIFGGTLSAGKINFWVYFVACYKLLSAVLAFDKHLGQIFMEH